MGCARYDVDFAHELFHGCLERGDRLSRHDEAGPLVLDLVHRAARTLAKTGEVFEVVVRPLVELANGLPDVVHGNLL